VILKVTFVSGSALTLLNARVTWVRCSVDRLMLVEPVVAALSDRVAVEAEPAAPCCRSPDDAELDPFCWVVLDAEPVVLCCCEPDADPEVAAVPPLPLDSGFICGLPLFMAPPDAPPEPAPTDPPAAAPPELAAPADPPDEAPEDPPPVCATAATLSDRTATATLVNSVTRMDTLLTAEDSIRARASAERNETSRMEFRRDAMPPRPSAQARIRGLQGAAVRDRLARNRRPFNHLNCFRHRSSGQQLPVFCLPATDGPVDVRAEQDARVQQRNRRSAEESMSSPLAVVLALALLIPILACAAAFSAAGVSSSFMIGAVTFAVVVAGVMAAIVEIKRLVGP
jgi:hypothetical protein